MLGRRRTHRRCEQRRDTANAKGELTSGCTNTAQKRKMQKRYARGNRQAVQRRCRARSAPIFRISVGFGLRGVCLSAARSAALVSRQAHAL